MGTETSWPMDIFRGLFASLTYCVYEIIEWVMHGIFDLANLQISDGLVHDIYMRIYVLLGIFMAFKLTISFLKYMANPDSMVDKEKGAGKLIVRVFTMLILIILLPNLFPVLNKVQTEFLPVLPRVILGKNVDNSNTVSDNAQILSTAALSAFYRPSAALAESDRPPAITSIDDMMNTYEDSVDGYYAYDFNFILAPVLGVVIVIILLSMTIKIGIRIFKMLILEMISPIPVMSYIDPKASKDGAFAAWVKQLTSTFLDIFVRLGIIYVVLMILTALAEGGGLSGLFNPNTVPTSGTRTAYLYVFLIVALLMFAKDAPNFVKDALGIKHDKDTSGALAAATGAVLGGATGFVSGAISGRGFKGAVTGFTTGVSNGVQSGMTGKKANVWSAAGDAALQARTGDPKAKSGILAAMQSAASKSQLNSSARKLNITSDTIEEAKQNMLEMQGLAGEAKKNWEYGIQTGIFKDLNGNDITMEEASDLVAKTSNASTIASKNYEKANKAGDTYRINKDFAGDLKKDKKDAKIDYKRGTITKTQYKAKGRFNPNKGHIDRA